MSCHNHRGARGVDSGEDIHNSRTCRRIEVTRGLISQHDRWLIDRCSGNSHPLLLATAEFVRKVLSLLSQADRLQNVGNSLVNKTGALADHPECVGDVVKHRFLREQAEVLKHHTQAAPELRHFAARNTAQVLSQNVDLTRTGSLLFEDEAQEA